MRETSTADGAFTAAGAAALTSEGALTNAELGASTWTFDFVDLLYMEQ